MCVSFHSFFFVIHSVDFTFIYRMHACKPFSMHPFFHDQRISVCSSAIWFVVVVAWLAVLLATRHFLTIPCKPIWKEQTIAMLATLICARAKLKTTALNKIRMEETKYVYTFFIYILLAKIKCSAIKLKPTMIIISLPVSIVVRCWLLWVWLQLYDFNVHSDTDTIHHIYAHTCLSSVWS